ncbi:unnamed protein product, partial [Chrysoparadoxa australica]
HVQHEAAQVKEKEEAGERERELIRAELSTIKSVMKDRVNELEAEVAALKGQLAARDGEVETLTSQLKGAEERVEQEQKCSQGFKDLCDASAKSLNEAREEKTSKEERLAEASCTVGGLREQLSSLEDQVKSLSTELSGRDQALKEREADALEKGNKVQELELLLGEANVEASKLRDARDGLSRKLADKEGELQISKSSAEEMHRLVSELTNTASRGVAREEEVQHLRDQVASLQGLLMESNTAQHDAFGKVAQLEGALAGMQRDSQDVRDLNAKSQAMQARIDELALRNNTLVEDIKVLRHELHEEFADKEIVAQERDEALGLCSRYQESLHLSLRKIEEACIVHLGNGRDQQPGATVGLGLDLLMGSEGDALTGKLNRALERIMGRLSSTSKLRQHFHTVMKQAEDAAKSKLAQLEVKCTQQERALRKAEVTVDDLKQDRKYTVLRAVKQERQTCQTKIDAVSEENRVLNLKVSSLEGELEQMHAHSKRLKDQATAGYNEVKEQWSEECRRRENAERGVEDVKDEKKSLEFRIRELEELLGEEQSKVAQAQRALSSIGDERERLSNVVDQLEREAAQQKRNSKRQVDAEIFHQMKETQNLLASQRLSNMSEIQPLDLNAEVGASAAGHAGEHRDGLPANRQAHRSGGLQGQVQQLGDVLRELTELVNVTGLFMDRYEQGRPALFRDGAADCELVAALENQCYQLLDSNAQLALQAQNLALDLQRLERAYTTTSSSKHVAAAAAVVTPLAQTQYASSATAVPTPSTPGTVAHGRYSFTAGSTGQSQISSLQHLGVSPRYGGGTAQGRANNYPDSSNAPFVPMSPGRVYGRAVLTPSKASSTPAPYTSAQAQATGVGPANLSSVPVHVNLGAAHATSGSPGRQLDV